MLEGLEISEVRFSKLNRHVDSRIDPEFHQKMPLENPEYEWGSIGDYLTHSQYGISIEMNELGQGTPIYRMNEIHNMLCDSSISKSAEITDEEVETFKLKPRDVLFNRTNSQAFVGRTGMYFPSSSQARVFASYLVRFKTDEKIILPEYLVSFLNSRQGVKDIKRRARISINQSNVNPEEVKAIRIPLVSLAFQKTIKTSFASAHAKLQESERLHQEAEETLLSALGLEDWTPPNPLTYESSFSNAFAEGRLDAEFFQPWVDGLYKHLGNNETLMKDVCNLRKERIKSTENQFNYLEIGSLTSDGVVQDSYISGKEAPSRATWNVKQGDVLTSTVRPARAISAIIEPHQEGAVESSGFAVLEPVSISSELLLCYLKLPEICKLMDLYTASSMYPAITVSDILNLPFKHPGKKVEEKIIQLIQTSRAKKKQSQTLLERAKKAVEIAIEKGEETAFAYLDGKHYLEEELIPKLFQANRHYVNLETVKSTIQAEALSYEDSTIIQYLNLWEDKGIIHDAGRGWYSDLEKRLTHGDSDLITQLRETLKTELPYLEYSLWSTQHLSPYFQHLPTKHATFLMLERDAFEPVKELLEEEGLEVVVHPLGEMAKAFQLKADHTIIIRPKLSSDHTEELLPIEKELVDFYYENQKLGLYEGAEIMEVFRTVANSYRLNVAALARYAERRKLDSHLLLKMGGIK